jgi:hypothetical protein
LKCCLVLLTVLKNACFNCESIKIFPFLFPPSDLSQFRSFLGVQWFKAFCDCHKKIFFSFVFSQLYLNLFWNRNWKTFLMTTWALQWVSSFYFVLGLCWLILSPKAFKSCYFYYKSVVLVKTVHMFCVFIFRFQEIMNNERDRPNSKTAFNNNKALNRFGIYPFFIVTIILVWKLNFNSIVIIIINVIIKYHDGTVIFSLLAIPPCLIKN